MLALEPRIEILSNEVEVGKNSYLDRHKNSTQQNERTTSFSQNINLKLFQVAMDEVTTVTMNDIMNDRDMKKGEGLDGMVSLNFFNNFHF